MRKTWIVPAGAAVLGAVASFIRKRQLEGGFEELSGLAKRGVMETTALYALTIVAVVAAAALTWVLTRHHKAPGDFGGAFHSDGFIAPIASALGGLAVLAGTALCLADMMKLGAMNIIVWVYVAFGLLGGLAIVAMSAAMRFGQGGRMLALSSVIPPIFFCFRMMVLYRGNLGNPVLLDFAYGCIAYAAAALAFYYLAGFAYGRTSVGRTVAFSFLALYFLLLDIADLTSLYEKLISGGAALSIAVLSERLLSSLTVDGGDA